MNAGKEASPVRTVGLVHDVPRVGHTGGQVLFHRIRDVLRRHFEVREYSFARGGPKASAVFYPFLPLARPVGEGLRQRTDVVVTNLSGIFPVPGDLFYVQPPPARTRQDTLLRRLGFGRPPPTDLWPKPIEWLWYGRLVRPLLDAAARDALDRTGTLVAASELVRRDITAELGRDALVVRPSLDTDSFENLPKLARPVREARVLIVSRIDATKRLEEAIEIAAQCPEIRFTLLGRVPVGGEATVDRLRRASRSGNLEIVPNAPEGLKRELMARAAAFLSTSHRETFTNAAVEATLAGAVAIVPADSGVREVLGPQQVYSNLEEAVDRIRSAVRGELRISSEIRTRVTAVADPARFEGEILDAVRQAYGLRRR